MPLKNVETWLSNYFTKKTSWFEVADIGWPCDQLPQSRCNVGVYHRDRLI